MRVPIRPLNRCQSCHYTWHPRGKNLSHVCPRCGSGAVEIATISSEVVGGGCLVILVLALIGALLGERKPKQDNPAPEPPTKTAKKSEKEETPHLRVRPRSSPFPTEEEVLGKPKPMPKAEKHRPEKDKPIKSVPIPPPHELSTAPLIAVAPPPHLVDYSVPPESASYVMDWQRRGNVETRVIGVLAGRVPLCNRAGHDFVSTDPALRIWVETRAVAGTDARLRRWGSTLEPTTLSSGAVKIARSSVVSGSDVLGELYGTRELIPGEPGIRDVLVFELPPASAKIVMLTLDGRHVGQSGEYTHLIPAVAWKK